MLGSNMEKTKKEILRIESLEWFFSKGKDEKKLLKDKYFPFVYIPTDAHWGIHFTFGQIEEMYVKEGIIRKNK